MYSEAEKTKDADDAHVKEYRSIDKAIADLENDVNVPPGKTEKNKIISEKPEAVRLQLRSRMVK